jgi:hypothetical protein
VHDAWPKARQVPYLVSVADPYDYISPHHVWSTRALGTIGTAARAVYATLSSSATPRAVRMVRLLTERGRK